MISIPRSVWIPLAVLVAMHLMSAVAGMSSADSEPTDFHQLIRDKCVEHGLPLDKTDDYGQPTCDPVFLHW